MPIRIQNRRGTASEWTTANPTLSSGEIGFETDTGKFKIGNGSTEWDDLPYSSSSSSLASIGDLTDVDTSDKTNGSILYYDSSASRFKADDINTKLTLADGGNF
jgi:hypothetical protein